MLTLMPPPPPLLLLLVVSDVVQLLLAHRAEVTLQDTRQRSALQRAIEYNHVQVASVLLECGALDQQVLSADLTQLQGDTSIAEQ